MSSSALLQSEPAPITACTVCRDVQNFDLLIEDMEALLGENWGDLSFADTVPFLAQPEAAALEFIVIAMDPEDESDVDQLSSVIMDARGRGIGVLLIAEDVSPSVLHMLLRQGADEFLPYPLPEGALAEAIEKLRTRPSEPQLPALAAQPTDAEQTGNHDGVVLPVHGMAGGVGATTFAVNLAWELALAETERARAKRAKEEFVQPRVCLLDFDFQTGSVSTYLDLAREESIYELLSDTESVDRDAMVSAMQVFQEKLHVFTAPKDMLPLDIVGPEDIEKLINNARSAFDYVVVDMPTALVSWSETVLHAAHVYFAVMELDMRSAQNCLRFVRLLKGEDLPIERLRFAMNRAPKFSDLQGKARVKRLAESLDIDIELLLPEGQKQVAQAGDHGLPLAEGASKNPLRKEIMKLAGSLHELAASDRAAAG